MNMQVLYFYYNYLSINKFWMKVIYLIVIKQFLSVSNAIEHHLYIDLYCLGLRG